jgi:hypothetical protein
LRDDAKRFDGVAAGLKNGFGVAEKPGGFGELQPVLRAVEIDEGGDGSDVGLCVREPLPAAAFASGKK